MKITGRMWFLIIAVVLSCMSIFVSFNPFGITFLQEGVTVTSVEVNTSIYDSGLRTGMIIQEINGNEIKDINDFNSVMSLYSNLEKNITSKLSIQTNSIEIIGLFDSSVNDHIHVKNIPKTKLETGLDLQGGARAFVQVDAQIDDNEANDLISVLEQRLNTYGLSDIEIYISEQLDNEKLVVVEIAGSNPEELERLIGSQGNFVAKIGNDTVFVGGEEDITHVGRTGQEALIETCQTASDGEYCVFRFVISLSAEAAQRHADITNKLNTEGGCIPRYDPNCYLEEQIDFFVDDILTSSLNIGADLKGNPATSIQISGSGTGPTRDEAIEAAKQEMKTLQTILITGSLPYDLEIVKIDRISPNLGSQFVRQILLAGLFAIIAVTLFTFIRYRKIKISVAIILVSLSEVLMILGIAGLIRWNLDLLSIAGIIAAIGTGIDSQIIILDESRNKNESLKDRIKKALFIITTAFATTFFALLPLTGMVSFLGISAASAGVLKGFALTTLVGILVGVLISRPAFADIVRQLEDE
jgi:preprotein translocase subunit SecD